MTWTDNKISYNMIPQRWILNYLKMYKKKIRPNSTVYQEDHENMENRIDSKRTKLKIRNKLKRYIPGICIITVTICESRYATQPHP